VVSLVELDGSLQAKLRLFKISADHAVKPTEVGPEMWLLGIEFHQSTEHLKLSLGSWNILKELREKAAARLLRSEKLKVVAIDESPPGYFQHVRTRDDISASAEFREVFTPGGEVLPPGATVRQPPTEKLFKDFDCDELVCDPPFAWRNFD
jgi:hypothetical protein